MVTIYGPVAMQPVHSGYLRAFFYGLWRVAAELVAGFRLCISNDGSWNTQADLTKLDTVRVDPRGNEYR